MMRQSVGRAAGVAQLIAAGMLALVGARFGTQGVLFAVATRAPTLESGRALPPPPPATTSAPRATPAPPPPVGPTVKLGSTLRLSLIVSSGSTRSEVLVDGVKVGQAPYVGEVTCRAGESVKIDLLPPKGLPQSFERKCAPGTLRVGD